MRKVDDVPITLALPADTPAGGVVVIQEAFGVTDHIVDVCSRLAQRGYAAAAPHLYHRLTEQVFAGDDIPAASLAMRTLESGGITADLTAAISALRTTGVGHIGILGFCMGGSLALWAASSLPVDAAVTFYGGGVIASRWPGIQAGMETAPRLAAPWLGIYGDQDASIDLDAIEALRQRVAAAPVDTKIVRYPDAGHGFHNDSRVAHFDASAAADAWERTLLWFDTYLR
ncbi:dienelactone hydrolase family protein [Nakamurella antarctica]|uniref:Dienelactone hydrolase family protein n=2 Tax=Nakamurella antarctica TaxID=1902245 RepID=A0A3G8ZQ97_9ACTN|nr:dienelactone hydrolase family protein [Nakamurella antarctica]